MKEYFVRILCFACLCAFLMVPQQAVFAQNSAADVIGAVNGTADTPQNGAEPAPIDPKAAPYGKSLFFTDEEISAIQRSLLGISPTGDTQSNKPKKPRILKLSGVLYKSPEDWVVWLNGQRVTPKNILPEIINIEVEPTKIHLKWFDYGFNDVIFITLRPNQFYDIETGLLLPGKG
ncbi:MAG: hypothetical protein HND56_09155 [Pseudomonadota bacterium]|nr:hypothetical protein [Pseudomonadota bacterium]QKK05845.1 MAG: hypothetical protein HND56_09155 [Pseudomonadota bacterium]